MPSLRKNPQPGQNGTSGKTPQQEQKCTKRSKRYYAYQVDRIEQKLQAVVDKIRNMADLSDTEVERRILYTRLTQLRNRLQILQINLQKKL